MKIKYHTLGCKVNSVETDRLRRDLADLGFIEVASDDAAELVLINTCSVTRQSDRKSAQLIRAALRRGSQVVAMGCYEPKAMAEEVLYIPNARKHEAAAIIAEAYRPLESDGSLLRSGERTRFFLKIQDGCNSFCSYCIIPYLRGRERSLNESEIIKEAQYALAQGHQELVLTGINLSAYGKDTNTSLIELIEKLDQLPGVARIRLGSLEQEVIDADFLARAAKLRAFCPHFHLSLQSGSASVLKRMNRHYTPAQFLAKMEMIRSVFPEAGMTSDIIAGFSGETEAEFEETLAFVRQARFHKVHVFPFSKREGTRAALLSDLPGDVKKERARQLRELCNAIGQELLDPWLGRQVEVLTEEGFGYTRNYLPVYYSQHLPANQLVKLQIEEREENSLRGVPIL